MKKQSILSGAVLAALVFLMPVSVQAESKVIAKINGIEITEAEFKFAEMEVGAEIAQYPPDQKKLILLNFLIENQLLAGAAQKDKLDQDPSFKLRQQYYNKRAMRDAYFEKKVRESVTDEEAKKFFDEKVSTVKAEEEIKARHILVKTEEEAKEVVAELGKGTDFVKLAEQKSDGPSKAQGGDLGYFSKGRMVKEFEDTAFALKVGEVSKPVKTEFGWHIIKVEDKRTRPLPKFEEHKDAVKNALLQQKAQETVQNLRKEAKIEISDPELDKQMKQIMQGVEDQSKAQKEGAAAKDGDKKDGEKKEEKK